MAFFEPEEVYGMDWSVCVSQISCYGYVSILDQPASVKQVPQNGEWNWLISSHQLHFVMWIHCSEHIFWGNQEPWITPLNTELSCLLCYKYWLSDQYSDQYSNKNISFYLQRRSEHYPLHTRLKTLENYSLNDSQADWTTKSKTEAHISSFGLRAP